VSRGDGIEAQILMGGTETMTHTTPPLCFRYVGQNCELMGRTWMLLGIDEDSVILWSSCYEEYGMHGQTWRGDAREAKRLFKQVL